MKNTYTKPARQPCEKENTRQDPICQVILHNDDRNSVEHVVKCLQTVFAYNLSLAAKIMLEAHLKGRSIAEVEAESPAIEHRDQLRSYGLSATVETM